MSSGKSTGNSATASFSRCTGDKLAESRGALSASVQSIAAGVAAAATSWALLPMLFKGNVVFKRELVAEQKKCEQIDGLRLQQIAERDEENDRLLAANAKLDAELKEQNRAMAEQTREVFNAVRMLQGLAGLAAQERRQSGND